MMTRIKELMNTYRLPLVAAAILTAAVAGFLLGGSDGSGVTEAPDAAVTIDIDDVTTWTCSMHPQIRQPEPGQCPICGMDLIPVENEGISTDLGPRQIRLSPHAEKLAQIQTALVRRQFVEHEITVLGEVEHDETRMKYIASWVPGRIDNLYVDYTGVTVNRGDRLADIYSPTLYAAQEEYLQALRTASELSNSKLSTARDTAELTVTAAREKLRLLGMTAAQIMTLRDRGTPGEHITIYSGIDGVVTERTATTGMYVDTGTRIYTVVDLSSVWVELEIYESDLPWVKLGQEVWFSTESYPGHIFTGNVAFIDPEVDSRTRTIDVRVDVPNSDGRLKPDMFVDATIRSTLADQGAVLVESEKDAAAVEAPLVIPRSAPLITGKRAVVYVRVDGKPGVYEGREIVLGPRAGDFFIVRDGITEYEEVVVHGNFKIDSALQILAKPSMMNPEDGVSSAGLINHGDMGGDIQLAEHEGLSEMDDHSGHDMQADEQAGGTAKSFNAPDAFLEQLDGVYNAYFRIRTALAGDSLADAKEAGNALQDSLTAVDMTLLANEPHMFWMDQLAVLNTQTGIITGTDDMDIARQAFSPLSETIIKAAQTFGHAGNRTLYQFHCPMAFDNTGADWLQAEPELTNPYFGSAMLKCGSRVHTYPETTE